MRFMVSPARFSAMAFVPFPLTWTKSLRFVPSQSMIDSGLRSKGS